MTELRRLTDLGIIEARRRLNLLRQGTMHLSEVSDLFRNQRWCGVFDGGVSISPQDFRTRRETADYLSATLGHLRSRIRDDRGVWSFLGMYFLENTTERTDGTRFVAQESRHLFGVGPRAAQRKGEHCLWGAWQLYEQHRDGASFLLDERLASWTDMAHRAFGSLQIFHARGVIPLMQRLYVREGRPKRGSNKGTGGLRHLVRVLNQLERTHDVYGDMSPDAILEILPAEFRAWDGK